MNDDLSVNTLQLARILGVGRQRVQQYQNEGMPKAARDEWSLPAVWEWWRDRMETRAALSGSSEELRKAQTEKVELQNAMMRSELIPIGDFRSVLFDAINVLISGLDNAETQFDDPRIRDQVREVTDQIRGNLQSKLDDLAGDIRSSGVISTPAENATRRVGRKVSSATRRRTKARALVE